MTVAAEGENLVARAVRTAVMTAVVAKPYVYADAATKEGDRALRNGSGAVPLNGVLRS